MTVKPGPERFQLTQLRFEMIITFEEHVMDIVVEGLSPALLSSLLLSLSSHSLAVLNSRDPVYDEPVHVFNLDVPDNAESAALGAQSAKTLATMVPSTPLLSLSLLSCRSDRLVIDQYSRRSVGGAHGRDHRRVHQTRGPTPLALHLLLLTSAPPYPVTPLVFICPYYTNNKLSFIQLSL